MANDHVETLKRLRQLLVYSRCETLLSAAKVASAASVERLENQDEERLNEYLILVRDRHEAISAIDEVIRTEEKNASAEDDDEQAPDAPINPD